MGKIIKAVILAGGKGERMRPLTDHTPKPLLKVGDRTLLEYSLLFLKKYGIKNFIISTGYQSKKIKKYFGDGRKWESKISYLEENETALLGTAGNFIKLKKVLTDTFLVCYADIIRELDLTDLLQFHRRHHGLATICVYKNKNNLPKSIVAFNKKKAIISFVERPEFKQEKKFVWSNASLYIFEPGVFSFLENGKKSDFAKDIIPKMLLARIPIYAYVQKGYFLDVGSLTKLSTARKDFQKGKFHVTD